MNSTIRSKLAALPTKENTLTLKQRFYDVMPDIENALARGVLWAAILAELRDAGLEIEPETASNYASQFRKRTGTLKWTIRRNGGAQGGRGAGSDNGRTSPTGIVVTDRPKVSNGLKPGNTVDAYQGGSNGKS